MPLHPSLFGESFARQYPRVSTEPPPHALPLSMMSAPALLLRAPPNLLHPGMHPGFLGPSGFLGQQSLRLLAPGPTGSNPTPLCYHTTFVSLPKGHSEMCVKFELHVFPQPCFFQVSISLMGLGHGPVSITLFRSWGWDWGPSHQAL